MIPTQKVLAEIIELNLFIIENDAKNALADKCLCNTVPAIHQADVLLELLADNDKEKRSSISQSCRQIAQEWFEKKNPALINEIIAQGLELHTHWGRWNNQRSQNNAS
jgi:S-methylmethionine-dependent homocysteine/selenocysteine methylase